jgi:hypothetical protein
VDRVILLLTHKNARFPLLPSDLQITLNLSDMGGKLDRSIASCDFLTKGKPRKEHAEAYVDFLAFEKVRVAVPEPIAHLVHIKCKEGVAPIRANRSKAARLISLPRPCTQTAECVSAMLCRKAPRCSFREALGCSRQ